MILIDSIVKPISSRIVCDINHPVLLEPLRKIYVIRWHIDNIKKSVKKLRYFYISVHF